MELVVASLCMLGQMQPRRFDQLMQGLIAGIANCMLLGKGAGLKW